MSRLKNLYDILKIVAGIVIAWLLSILLMHYYAGVTEKTLMSAMQKEAEIFQEKEKSAVAKLEVTIAEEELQDRLAEELKSEKYKKYKVLKELATKLTENISSYYSQHSLIPVYVSELMCAHQDFCPTVQNQGRFYIFSENSWISVSPYYALGSLYFDCRSPVAPIENTSSFANPENLKCYNSTETHTPTPAQAVLDCTKASSKVENELCHSDKLIEIDRMIYHKLLRSLPKSQWKCKTVEVAHMQIIRYLERFCSDSACYLNRMSELLLKLNNDEFVELTIEDDVTERNEFVGPCERSGS